MPLQCTSAQNLTRSTNIPTQSAATILALVQISSTGSGYAGMLALFRNQGGTQREIGIITQEGTNAILYWTNGGASASTTLTTGLAANTPFWIALRSGGTAIGALDGFYKTLPAVSWTTASNGSTVDALAPTRIHVNDDGYASGGVSNMIVFCVKVWDAVLSDEELLQETRSLLLERTANINGYYPMLGQTLANNNTDYSGLGRTWSNTGTPTVNAAGHPVAYSTGAPKKRYFSPAAGGFTGTLAVTLDALTLAGTSTLLIEGDLAETLAALTLAATGTVRIDGELAETLGAVLLSGSGNIGDGFTGSLNEALAALTLAGTSTVRIDGSLNETLAALVLSGTGLVRIDGTLSVTLEPVVLSGVGVLGAIVEAVSGNRKRRMFFHLMNNRTH